MDNNWNLVPEELRERVLSAITDNLWEEYADIISNPSNPMGKTVWELVQISRNFLRLPIPELK